MWIVSLAIVAGFALSIGEWVRRSCRGTIGMPKGPQGYPILGTWLRRYPEQTLHKWAREYGPLYSFTIGNQRFVVVSDPAIAKDLLLRKGAVCSDRKDWFIKGKTILKDGGITSTRYGDKWHRRIATTSLNPESVNRETGMLDLETTRMIRALYRGGANGKHLNPQAYIGSCSLNCMLRITFGTPKDSAADPLVPQAQALALSREFMNTTGPMSNLVDFMPAWLQRSLPWEMKRRGKQLHVALMNTYGSYVKRIENRMDNHEHVEDCLAKTMVATKDREQLDYLDMAMLASAFMVGGVETTASIIEWFSALIPSHKHVQDMAHEELDRVVGRNRLPTLEDKVNMPYCRAIIKEVERCHNPFWLGTPHAASKDVVYKDLLIPAGSVLVLNTWTMHHDPVRWPDPLTFNPERYLDDGLSSSESARLPDPYSRDHWTFGAGRRICPGMLVAEREIWLAISKMLWAFTMAEVPNKPINLKEYDGASGRSPIPFEMVLQPRFRGVEKVMAEAEKASSGSSHSPPDGPL
ncbi:cytochrome P450 [Pyrenophora tritici-repentis]|nr:cytochrome P450 [Pyrenophora tritici-repentis]